MPQLPSSHSTPKPSQPWWRWTSIVLAILWFGFLLTMVLTSANPPTVNRQQILDSESVVEAEVVDLTAGKVQSIKVHLGPNLIGELKITNLAETGAIQGETYLLPLMPERKGAWSVTPSPLPDTRHPAEANSPGLPLIYPVCNSTLQQLSAIRGSSD